MKFTSFLLFIFIFQILFQQSYTNTIIFPEINLYSEFSTNFNVTSSYLIDMVIDTGVKYGVQVGLGFKGYNFISLNSNLIRLSSLKIYVTPFELVTMGYFIGKNKTLGYSDVSYKGFQYHKRENMEYLGYKDITGMGVELYKSLWDDLFEPHIYIYSQNPVIGSKVTNTNSLNVDTLMYLRTDNYQIEFYAGINMKPVNLSNFSFNYSKHLGFFFKTYYGKLDFQISMYLPDSYTNKGFNGLFELPSPDAMYLNITEHIIAGYFEQSLTLFSRPSYYNEFEETITGDLDIYLALGGKFNSFGSGLENTVSMIDSFSSIDNKIGAFAYFIMNNLQYKVGAYYNIRIIPLSLAYPLWGVYINIMGNL